mgnify:CR=1 FL=1
MLVDKSSVKRSKAQNLLSFLLFLCDFTASLFLQ